MLSSKLTGHWVALTAAVHSLETNCSFMTSHDLTHSAAVMI